MESEFKPVDFANAEPLHPIAMMKPLKIRMQSYIIDADRAAWLLEKKIINKTLYVYFALKMDYPDDPNPDIEVGKFIEKWGLTSTDLDKAIATLQEKDALCRMSKQLELRFFDNDGNE